MSVLQNTSQKSSQAMPNKSRINNMPSMVQDHQHSVRIGALTKQTLKKIYNVN